MNARPSLRLSLAALALAITGCASPPGIEFLEAGTDAGRATREDATTDASLPHRDSGADGGVPQRDSATDATAGMRDVAVERDATETDVRREAGAETGSTKLDAGVDATPHPVPAVGSIRVTHEVANVIGITGEDLLAYYDPQGDIMVADIAGQTTMVAQGPTTDGGVGPSGSVVGNFVTVLTDYTSLYDGVNLGTLSIWSKELGGLKQVAASSMGTLAVAADSSFLVYTDSVSAAGTAENIGVIAADGTGMTDLLTDVYGSGTACPPTAAFDAAFVVVQYCSAADGAAGTTSTASFNGARSWAEVGLATNAVNFYADTSGINVMTLSGAAPSALSIQPLDRATETTVASPIGAVPGGYEFVYLSTASTFALFTRPDGILSKATFSDPTALSAPSVTSLAGADGGPGAIPYVYGLSEDEKYVLETDTPLDPITYFSTSLVLVDVATGATTPLSGGGADVGVFGGANNFTADSSYAVFTTALRDATSNGYLGNLLAAPVIGGPTVTLVSQPTVWVAVPLTGTNLLYNQNYVQSFFTETPNGAASADIYVTDVSQGGEGRLLVSQADAVSGNGPYFYVTKDKSHLFYTFSQMGVGDGGFGVPLPVDGLYAVAIP